MINRTIRASGAVSSGSDVGRSPTGASMPDIRGVGAAKGWSPTVANLLVILILEIVAFAAIRVLFKRISD